MYIIEKVVKCTKRPSLLYPLLMHRGMTDWVSDEAHLKLLYRAYVGENLNLVSPKTFNEKLQWLKLHDRNPLYNTLVDKYAVKEWVAERIGLEHLVKTYAVWDTVEAIDISRLPERFALKTNHDCGGVAICANRLSFDLDVAKNKMAKHLKQNYYWSCREWPYKNVKPLILAEEYLGNVASEDLVDYKFMCFGGRVKSIFTCTGRARNDLKVDFFDTEWNHLPFTRHYPNADSPPVSPENLSKMREMAEKLAEGIPFVRVDFYESAGRIYFGEMTFYPGAGFEEFDPPKWDDVFGSWIDLSLAYVSK